MERRKYCPMKVNQCPKCSNSNQIMTESAFSWDDFALFWQWCRMHCIIHRHRRALQTNKCWTTNSNSSFYLTEITGPYKETQANSAEWFGKTTAGNTERHLKMKKKTRPAVAEITRENRWRKLEKCIKQPSHCKEASAVLTHDSFHHCSH